MKCNVCGSTDFTESRKGQPRTVCARCGSLERTRVLMLFLQKYDMPKEGMRVLHFAPEEGIARYIQGRVGSRNYETYDIAPKHYNFDFQPARRLDLCKEISLLNNRRYDLIIHNHVLEHLPCNYSMILLQLHALLKPNGRHAFSVPIRAGMTYSEDFGDLPRDERISRFGQGGHIRNFGADDLDKSIGMIFDIRGYALTNFFTPEELTEANVSKSKWGQSSACVYYLDRNAAPVLRTQ